MNGWRSLSTGVSRFFQPATNFKVNDHGDTITEAGKYINALYKQNTHTIEINQRNITVFIFLL
jgi:hypothetical protein